MSRAHTHIGITNAPTNSVVIKSWVWYIPIIRILPQMAYWDYGCYMESRSPHICNMTPREISSYVGLISPFSILGKCSYNHVYYVINKCYWYLQPKINVTFSNYIYYLLVKAWHNLSSALLGKGNFP